MIYSHSPIEFRFNKNSENFVVEEIPLYPFAHTGEWLMLKIRKKGLTTPEMLKRFSAATGIKLKDIGYAGLKDKEGMTLQWISVPRKFRERVRSFSDPQIKIVEEDLHRNKLKIGHLKGNRFFIRLKKVLPSEAKKIYGVLKQVRKVGIPNFFGPQRFGKFGNNWKEGEAIVKGEKKVRDRRLRRFLINAYQSKLFNDWLAYRILLSNTFELSERELKGLGFEEETIKLAKSQPHPFKLLPGEVMTHYPLGKFFLLGEPRKGEEGGNIETDLERFWKKEVVPTGPLPGERCRRAVEKAGKVEELFWKEIPVEGDRRVAWIFPEIVDTNYIKDYAQFELAFILPKGAYATTLLTILEEGIKPFLNPEELPPILPL